MYQTLNLPDYLVLTDKEKERATIRKRPNTYHMWLDGLDYTYLINIIKTTPTEHLNQAIGDYYEYQAKRLPTPTEIPVKQHIFHHPV